MNTLNLHLRANRCAAGFDLTTQHGDNGLCKCPESASVTAGTDWHTFVTALKQAVRDNGEIHQGDVRPLIQTIPHKSRGLLYRRARTLGLIEQVGLEQSTDVAGRNGDKLQRIYKLRSAAA